jgi:hypothetical protein
MHGFMNFKSSCEPSVMYAEGQLTRQSSNIVERSNVQFFFSLCLG